MNWIWGHTSPADHRPTSVELHKTDVVYKGPPAWCPSALFKTVTWSFYLSPKALLMWTTWQVVCERNKTARLPSGTEVGRKEGADARLNNRTSRGASRAPISNCVSLSARWELVEGNGVRVGLWEKCLAQNSHLRSWKPESQQLIPKAIFLNTSNGWLESTFRAACGSMSR